jgi:hypothetical protein
MGAPTFFRGHLDMCLKCMTAIVAHEGFQRVYVTHDLLLSKLVSLRLGSWYRVCPCHPTPVRWWYLMH